MRTYQIGHYIIRAKAMKDVHRLDVKSAEQNFLSEIEYDFEIAPGVARSILESVKYHFDPEYFHDNGLITGFLTPIVYLRWFSMDLVL